MEKLRPFERVRIVGLQEASWKLGKIDAHFGLSISIVYRCFQHWPVEHSHTRRPVPGALSTGAC